jgi:hypothetical protein
MDVRRIARAVLASLASLVGRHGSGSYRRLLAGLAESALLGRQFPVQYRGTAEGAGINVTSSSELVRAS